MIRQPVVAGQFYPSGKKDLFAAVESYVGNGIECQSAVALVSPHAGYVYSGAVAGRTFSSAEISGDVVILGPNHHGRGHDAAVYANGSWITPLGEVQVASELASRVLAECPMAAEDTLAHSFEHSLEVQVPFVQFCSPGARVLPLCISHMPLATLLQLGEGLARAASGSVPVPLIVSSTDMTHYESGEIARKKDLMALEKVLALDPVGLYEVVRDNRISMCGVLPTVVTLQAALALGAKDAELIAYSNSGDVTGDQSEVVGYAGVRVF